MINKAWIKGQGSTQLLDVLNRQIPSLNVAREPISDAATLIRPANVRGLPADSTLYLVNGKRRHKSAIIGEFIAGLNKGAQPTDLNPISTAGIKQIEFLRDGAAAQYGSDAIAGVINIQLLADPTVRDIELRTGMRSSGCGEDATMSGAVGTYLGQEGFATLAFEAYDAHATSQGSQDPSAAALVAAGNTSVKDSVVEWGQPNVFDDYKVLLNAEVEAGDHILYAFGNWGIRDVDGSFFYRNPMNRQGVFTNSGSPLVFDLNATDGIDCAAEVSVAADGQVVDPNNRTANGSSAACFLYNQWFRGGFTPRFGGQVIDSALVIGLKGENNDGSTYDFSVSLGRNEIEYSIENTVNPSYGPNSPTSFNLGGQVGFESILSADFTKPFDLGLSSDVNLAYGIQYHTEHFQMIAGQTESFADGGFASPGATIGANGFPGFSSDFAGKFDRYSYGAYVDVEADLTEKVVAGAALRYEEFSDFGSNIDGKLAGRFQATDQFGLRGAFSSGFRAPSIGQSYLQRSSVSFDSGQLTSNLTVPPGEGALARLADVAAINAYNAANATTISPFQADALEPEESMNFSLGAVFSQGAWQLTFDAYRIEVDDRIILRGNVQVSDEQRDYLLASGISDAAGISALSFFSNAVDTTTTGFDLSVSRDFDFDAYGEGRLTLMFNRNNTRVDHYDPAFVQSGDGSNLPLDRQENLIRELEQGVPESRLNATFVHHFQRFEYLVRANYYGEAFELLLNEQCCEAVTDPMTTFDFQARWRVNWLNADETTVTFGVDNVFDKKPDQHEYAGQPGWLGADYPLNHSAGFDGAYYYVGFKTSL